MNPDTVSLTIIVLGVALTLYQFGRAIRILVKEIRSQRQMSEVEYYLGTSPLIPIIGVIGWAMSSGLLLWTLHRRLM